MVVDSSALVAIFRGEDEGKVFVDLIDGAKRASVSVVTVVETLSVLCGRRIGATRDHVDQLVRRLGLTVETVDERHQAFAMDALLAFGKGRHPARLNLGDVFSYALAKSLDAPLLFKGDDFAKTDILPAWRP